MKLLKTMALVATLGMFSMPHVYAQEAAPGAQHAMHKMNADTNQDGKISHEEFTAASAKRSEEHFKRMDANNDGFIDQAERHAAFAKMCVKHQHHRHSQDKAQDSKPS